MAFGEAVFFWIAEALYALASIGYFYALVFRRERPMVWATRALWAGLAAQTGAIVFRWGHTGHPPLIKTYESALLATWIVVLMFLVFYRLRGNLRTLGALVTPVSLLTLGYGVNSSPQLEPLTPPFQSNWLYIHILFAWAAYGAYLLATGLALLLLLRARQEARGALNHFYGRLPRLEIMDELAYRFIAFGFLGATVMLVAGAIWANQLFGSYWSWDPLETWSLVSWLVYGVYLHLRTIHGWRGTRTAWLVLLAGAVQVFSVWGVGVIGSGRHAIGL